jgi:hypothetical protein
LTASSPIGELILLLAVFGIGALQLDGKPLSEYGSHIANAAKLGPTIFPIIFAAVVGRLMKFCALWRAENGTNLGVRTLSLLKRSDTAKPNKTMC